jgi:hypothetical protein
MSNERFAAHCSNEALPISANKTPGGRRWDSAQIPPGGWGTRALKGTRRGSQWIFADRLSVLGVLQRFNTVLAGSQNCMIFGRLLPL